MKTQLRIQLVTITVILLTILVGHDSYSISSSLIKQSDSLNVNKNERNNYSHHLRTENAAFNQPVIDKIYNFSSETNSSRTPTSFSKKTLQEEDNVYHLQNNSSGFFGSLTFGLVKTDNSSLKSKQSFLNFYDEQLGGLNWDRTLLCKVNNQIICQIGFNRKNDSLFVFSEELDLISTKGIPSSNFLRLFSFQGNLHSLSRPTNQTFRVNKHNAQGDIIQSTYLADSIINYDISEDHFYLLGENQSYYFDSNINSYSIFNTGGSEAYLIDNECFIITETNTKVLNLINGIETILETEVVDVIAKTATNQIIYEKGSTIFKYSQSSTPTIELVKSLNNHLDVHYHNNYLLVLNANKMIEILDLFGSTLFTKSYNFYANQIDRFQTDNEGNFYIILDNKLEKLTNNGSLIWRLGINLYDFYLMNDNSIWGISDFTPKSIFHLENDQNRCSYSQLNPFDTKYCKSDNNTKHQIIPTFNGSSHGLSGGYMGYYSPYYRSHGISFKWYRNDSLINSDYLGNIDTSGIYKLESVQGNCTVTSPAKVVEFENYTYMTSPPSLETSDYRVCEGASISISSPNTYTNIKWDSTQITFYPNHNYEAVLNENRRFIAQKMIYKPTYLDLYGNGTTFLYSNSPYSGTLCYTEPEELSILVNNIPNPPTIELSDFQICPEETTIITGKGCNNLNYRWSTGENSNKIMVSPSTTTNYSLYCEDDIGCSSIERVVVQTVQLFNNTTSLSGNSTNNTHTRSGRVNSSEMIQNSHRIKYTAANSILLNPGFSTNENTYFEANVNLNCKSEQN